MSKKKKEKLKSKYVKSYKKKLSKGSDKVYRECLGLNCRKKFESTGPGNRKCQECLSKEAAQYSEKNPIKIVLSNRKIDQNTYDG